ncbi:MAG: hypothetical protein IKO22_04130 [Oscillospiraceae bacterium]|nr:hypothetical protein [Oscillospiraceae bacterium]
MEATKWSSGEWGRQLTGDLLRRWPRDEDGVLDAPVFLCHCSGLDMDEALLTSRMEFYGIPCLRQYPENGDFGKIILGVSGTGVDVYVPASLWADASELLHDPEGTT